MALLEKITTEGRKESVKAGQVEMAENSNCRCSLWNIQISLKLDLPYLRVVYQLLNDVNLNICVLLHELHRRSAWSSHNVTDHLKRLIGRNCSTGFPLYCSMIIMRAAVSESCCYNKSNSSVFSKRWAHRFRNATSSFSLKYCSKWGSFMSFPEMIIRLLSKYY